MDFLASSLLIVTLMGFLSSSSEGYTFFVGGKDGWVVDPTENYNHWAERNRFQVNDTLYFKYQKGSNSVLLVNKDDYYSCNNKNPIQSLTDGDSIFRFDHSGPFFFISGNTDDCNNGQKMIIVVLAVRQGPQNLPPSPSPSPVPVPAAGSPAGSPKAGETPLIWEVPAPAPSQNISGSMGSVQPTWLVLSFSVGLSVVLGSFIGVLY